MLCGLTTCYSGAEVTRVKTPIRKVGQIATAALALATVLSATVSVAYARDNGGVGEFFQQIFGGGRSVPQPSYDDQWAPPLTVRARPRHHSRPSQTAHVSRSPKETLAALKDVTIYTDKTLQRGDAVMTTNGMRVFNGSTSWPYKNDDFVALAKAPKISASVRKQLHAIDVASRADQRGN
jgi:hypothetical protein